VSVSVSLPKTDHRTTDSRGGSGGGVGRPTEKVIVPVRIAPPSPAVDDKKLRRLLRNRRFAPYPARVSTTSATTMFKQGYPPDGLANNQTAPAAAPSIPMPPPNTFNMQFNMGPPPGFSTFTPDYHQFPYTFSSATPPMYSWANTNSTDVMK